jgi:hypothetical protein
MGSINAYGPLVRDWESLADSCEANRDTLPGIEPVRAPLVNVPPAPAAARPASLSRHTSCS